MVEYPSPLHWPKAESLVAAVYATATNGVDAVERCLTLATPHIHMFCQSSLCESTLARLARLAEHVHRRTIQNGNATRIHSG